MRPVHEGVFNGLNTPVFIYSTESYQTEEWFEEANQMCADVPRRAQIMETSSCGLLTDFGRAERDLFSLLITPNWLIMEVILNSAVQTIYQSVDLSPPGFHTTCGGANVPLWSVSSICLFTQVVF